MDGIMVVANTTLKADDRHPLILQPSEFKFVDTGDVIHDPFNAVIMIEDVNVVGDTVEIIKPASTWQHIRPIGEDIVKGEMVIPAGHSIRPVDIGAMLSGGIFDLEVVTKPSIGILPTGTEIVEPTLDVVPGDIIDSNSRMFENLVIELGAIPTRYKAVADDYQKIKDQLCEMADKHDIILINAGSSAGSEDYTKAIIEELGHVIVHGVAIKPGKPAILGEIFGKPIIGIPGYPVSAFFVFDIYVKGLVKRWYEQLNVKRPTVKAFLSKRLMSSIKHEEYVRMKLGNVNGKLIATPLSRGAGVTMSLVNADGICVVPQSVEGYEAGTEVDIELLKDHQALNSTLVSIGSHDILMDVIRDSMKGVELSSTHVGSMGGVMAMMKNEAHIAPIHLLDEKSGVYNKAVVKKYLKNKDVVLIRGLNRIQGLYVKKNNPKNIKKLEDISNVQFVNRQKGSGTRVLLDYKLKENGINTQSVSGYEREMMTHMTVASAVKSGSADTGMGIESVAKMMDLEFIPIGEESYDFVVSKQILDSPLFEEFLSVLKSESFRKYVLSYGGYRIENIGEVIELDD
jgi:putative molybdopterin biosynthesis protein